MGMVVFKCLFKKNIIVIILNNSSLSLIKENANRISDINNDSYVNLKYGNPNFSKIAEAYGIKSIRINNSTDPKYHLTS